MELSRNERQIVNFLVFHFLYNTVPARWLTEKQVEMSQKMFKDQPRAAEDFDMDFINSVLELQTKLQSPVNSTKD